MLEKKRVRNKALRSLLEGDGSKIDARWRRKAERILAELNVAVAPMELDLPGHYFHELKGDRRGTSRYGCPRTGGSPFAGTTPAPTMSIWRTIMAESETGLGFRPPHPGEVLKHDILPELGMTQAALAEHLGIKRPALSALLNEKSDVSHEMAIRLGKAFRNGTGSGSPCSCSMISGSSSAARTCRSTSSRSPGRTATPPDPLTGGLHSTDVPRSEEAMSNSATPNNARGAAFALVAFGIYSTHDVVVKFLGGVYSPFQIVFFSNLFGFPIVTIMLMRDATDGNLRPRHPWWTLLRTAAAVLSTALVFYAFWVLPLAQTYAIVFAAPLLITILAIPILGETVGWHRWMAVLAGLSA